MGERNAGINVRKVYLYIWPEQGYLLMLDYTGPHLEHLRGRRRAASARLDKRGRARDRDRLSVAEDRRLRPISMIQRVAGSVMHISSCNTAVEASIVVIMARAY